MKWMELIRVRSTPASLEQALPRVQEHLHQLERSEPAETFFFATRCTTGTWPSLWCGETTRRSPRPGRA